MSTDARGCEVKGEKDGIAWLRRLLSPLGVMNGPKLPNLFEFHHHSLSQVDLFLFLCVSRRGMCLCHVVCLILLPLLPHVPHFPPTALRALTVVGVSYHSNSLFP